METLTISLKLWCLLGLAFSTSIGLNLYALFKAIDRKYPNLFFEYVIEEVTVNE